MIITGGSDGMGKAVACQLAAKGANIVIVARTTSKLKAALETIKVGLLFISPESLTLTLSSGFRDAHRSTEIPLHQRRPDQSRGLHTGY